MVGSVGLNLGALGVRPSGLLRPPGPPGTRDRHGGVPGAAAPELTAAAAEAHSIPVARTLPLERIAEAHDLVDAGSRGRILLDLGRASGRRQPRSLGLVKGNASVARMLAPVSIITSRSTPIPRPPVGGMAYSKAVRKPSSISMASGSPAAAL